MAFKSFEVTLSVDSQGLIFEDVLSIKFHCIIHFLQLVYDALLVFLKYGVLSIK